MWNLLVQSQQSVVTPELAVALVSLLLTLTNFGISYVDLVEFEQVNFDWNIENTGEDYHKMR